MPIAYPNFPAKYNRSTGAWTSSNGPDPRTATTASDPYHVDDHNAITQAFQEIKTVMNNEMQSFPGVSNRIVGGAAPRLALGQWEVEMARAVAAGGRAVITVIGDSIIEAGQGTGSSQALISHADLLRSWMQSKFGDGGLGFLLPNNRKWTKTGSWSDFAPLTAADRGFYGTCQQNSTSVKSSFSITTTCDRFDVFYIDTGTSVNATYKVDTGAETSFSTMETTHTNAMKKISVTGLSNASHTITIYSPASSTNKLYFCGAAFYRGTTGAILNDLSQSAKGTFNIYPGGSFTGDRTVLLDLIEAPHLLLLELMANNMFYYPALGFPQVSPATTQTHLQDLITKVKTTVTNAGSTRRLDTLVYTPNDLLDSAITIEANSGRTADQRAYELASYGAAVTHEAAFFNVASAWGAYENNTSRMVDGLHPNQNGQYDYFARIRQLLTNG